MRFATWSLIVILAATSAAGCAGIEPLPILATVPPGRLTWQGDLPIIELSGTPYEMGYQHGSIMRREVQASVKNVMAFIDRNARVPLIGKWLARKKLDSTWRQMEPFVPPAYIEELQGLADGARVPLKDLERIHALPELMSIMCASFAAFGKATDGGQMIQIRNLDWAIKSGVQNYAALFVVRPDIGRPFVNAGWLGFIGVISGINDKGIAVGEIGAETADASLKGIPMPFLLRRVLQESDDLKEGVNLVLDASRTSGYNYLFSDALEKQAVAIETTHRHAAVFWADQEPKTEFTVPVENAICRSDTAFDPIVRDQQIASKGNPKKPGLESPAGSSSYEVRYKKQAELLLKNYGRINPEIAKEIAVSIAPKSNVQSVIYAFPRIWVANARGRSPAVTQTYHEINLEDYF